MHSISIISQRQFPPQMPPLFRLLTRLILQALLTRSECLLQHSGVEEAIYEEINKSAKKNDAKVRWQNVLKL